MRMAAKLRRSAPPYNDIVAEWAFDAVVAELAR